MNQKDQAKKVLLKKFQSKIQFIHYSYFQGISYNKTSVKFVTIQTPLYEQADILEFVIFG